MRYKKCVPLRYFLNRMKLVMLNYIIANYLNDLIEKKQKKSTYIKHKIKIKKRLKSSAYI